MNVRGQGFESQILLGQVFKSEPVSAHCPVHPGCGPLGSEYLPSIGELGGSLEAKFWWA